MHACVTQFLKFRASSSKPAHTHAHTHVHNVKLSVAPVVVMLPGDTPGYLYTNTGKTRTSKLQEAVHVSEIKVCMGT